MFTKYLLDECLKLINDPQTCAEDFDTRINESKHGESTHRTFCLAYAFWLFISGYLRNSIHNSYNYIKLLDTVLIIYGPNNSIVKIVDESKEIDIVSVRHIQVPDSFLVDTCCLTSQYECDKITKLNDPSVSLFERNIHVPISIENLTSNWPALEKWKSPSFWVSTAGHRFFPVEIGNHYLDENWTQEIMQLNEYLMKYVFTGETENIAYIAQHNWIHQIPELMYDFEIPDLCDIFLNPEMICVLTHIWFGVKSTLTPLHYDRYNNIFTQIVGSKYVLLVDPKYSSLVSDGNGNTSNIGVECISEFLRENHVPFHEVILKEGEVLFIPSKWWHQVKSLSFSISISFWF